MRHLAKPQITCSKSVYFFKKGGRNWTLVGSGNVTDKLILVPTLVSLTAPQMGNVKGAAIKMSHRTLSGFAERHNVGYEDAG